MIDVPPGWSVDDADEDAVLILSPEPEFASFYIYYMGPAALSTEGYANKILKDREDAPDSSYEPIRKSSGGYTRYKTSRLDFEVRGGPEDCVGMVTELVARLKVEQEAFHLINVQFCQHAADRYQAPLDRILDSFFLYR